MIRSVTSLPIASWQRVTIAGPSSRPAITYRAFTSSAPVLKKSKAAAAKRAHKEAKEEIEQETGENPDRSRYEPAPNDDIDRVLEKSKERMRKATDWAKTQVYEGVERVSGKVSPCELEGLLK